MLCVGVSGWAGLGFMDDFADMYFNRGACNTPDLFGQEKEERGCDSRHYFVMALGQSYEQVVLFCVYVACWQLIHWIVCTARAISKSAWPEKRCGFDLNTCFV